MRNVTKIQEEAMSSNVVMCSQQSNYQKRAKEAEASNYQKRAAEAEAAAEEIIGFIGTIFDASHEELKNLCNKKGVKVVGKSAMKHKYACALLKEYVKK
jgi:hypothetical protein